MSGRWVQVAVAISAAGLISACGGGASSDQAQIESTLRSFLTAVADGDVSGACNDLMVSQQAVLIRETVAHGARTCPEAMQLLTSAVSAHERTLLKGASITDVKITGATATAQLQYETEQTRLEKTGGRWLITSGISH